jgi:hypothetical protein
VRGPVVSRPWGHATDHPTATLRQQSGDPIRTGTGSVTTRIGLATWLACIVLGWPSVLAAQVQITGLSDLPLGTWDGSSDMAGEDSHCVLAPHGGRFSIRATGDGPGDAFTLQNGAFHLPYGVSYNDGSGWSAMISGRPLSGQRGEPNANQLQRCLAGRRPPERVRVRVLAQDLGAAIAGGYSGRLTLLVAPE